jgi:hypothetical protein
MKTSLPKVILMFVFYMVFVNETFAQAPEAVITVEAVSPQELHLWAWPSHPSNGLKVVGKGELVYLSGAEADDEAINSYTWSFASLPNGSALTDLDSTSTSWTTFRPDTTGQFEVQLSISTASGTSDTTVAITSAKYVGIGTIGGATASFPQCGLGGCHTANATAWEDTRHASKVTREIDGLGSSFYNESCLECHTVGNNDEAVNDGFDDIQALLGWTFPDSLQAGNWADMVTNFPELAQRANIQCENCHGAGSEHGGDTTKIDVSLDEGVCGRCHEEEPYHLKNIQWKNSGHSDGVGFAAGRSVCNNCHSGWGFIDRIDGVPDDQRRVGFQQNSCPVCHDPHDATNDHQLRSLTPVTLPNGVEVDGGHGNICMNCHQSRHIIDDEFVSAEEYVDNYLSRINRSYGPHHGPQTDLLAGTNVITFGQDLPSTQHLSVTEDACVRCHMAEPIEGAENFMGEHTWAMHWNGGTPDSVSTEDDEDNIAPCQECHVPFGESFSDKVYYDPVNGTADHDGNGITEGVQLEVRGLLDTLEAVLLADTTKFLLRSSGDIRMRDSSVTLTEASAVYNHNFVLEDKSMGIHNPAYAVAMLQTSIKALRGELMSLSKKDFTIPDQYSLSQNYPNPFNPTTQIEFKIVSRGLVTLRIYDALGRVVARLVNEELNPGTYNVEFTGQNLASGIYIYSLTAENFSQNRKMILMK